MSTFFTWWFCQCLEGARTALETAAQIPSDQWSGAARDIFDARVGELRGLLAGVEESVEQAELDIGRFRVAMEGVEAALCGGQHG